MPNFSRRSRAIVDTCHNDIIAVCNELILITDFTVLHGHRKPEEQFELFKRGRFYKEGEWVLSNKTLVVTHYDGYKKLSKHNGDPSDAIDITPYPINWKNLKRIHFLAGSFLTMAYRLRIQNIITSSFSWGGHWNKFKDYPHFQIKRKV